MKTYESPVLVPIPVADTDLIATSLIAASDPFASEPDYWAPDQLNL